MNCFEFKKLALSDPNSRDASFIKHSAECPDCLKYVASVRKMDADLAASLDVAVPSDLVARLQLNTEISVDEQKAKPVRQYAIAASFAVALFVAGFMASSQFSGQNNIIAVEVDFESLGAFEAAHQKMLSQVSAEDWNTYRTIFDKPATWTHWIKYDTQEGSSAVAN